MLYQGVDVNVSLQKIRNHIMAVNKILIDVIKHSNRCKSRVITPSFLIVEL